MFIISTRANTWSPEAQLQLTSICMSRTPSQRLCVHSRHMGPPAYTCLSHCSAMNACPPAALAGCASYGNNICPNVTFCRSYIRQEAFEKCWAHSPLRATARPFTRCRHCRTRASMFTTWQRGPLWPHGMGPISANIACCSEMVKFDARTGAKCAMTVCVAV